MQNNILNWKCKLHMIVICAHSSQFMENLSMDFVEQNRGTSTSVMKSKKVQNEGYIMGDPLFTYNVSTFLKDARTV